MIRSPLCIPRHVFASAAAVVLLVAIVPALAQGEATTARALTNCTVSQADIDRDSEETAFLALINAFRANPAQLGWPGYPAVPALSFSAGLDRPAAWGVNDMAEKKYFAHTEPAPSNRTFDQRIVQCGYTNWLALGENIAAGNITDTAVEAFNLWINSTGHRNSMMSANFTEIGIARKYGPCPLTPPFNGQGSCWYWSTDFGKPSGGGGGGSQGAIFQFSGSSYAASESTGEVTATVNRIGGSGTVSVTCRAATTGGTATAGVDFTAGDIVLTFTASETQKTCRVPVANDADFENNETIRISLVNGTSGTTLGTPNLATLTITNDDSQPLPGSLQFAAGAYSGAENDGAISAVVLRVGGSAGVVSVMCVSAEGTATAGDFTAVSMVLSWADGDASDKVCSIVPVDDSDVEPGETLNLTLSNPQGATAGSPTTATVTITNDDSVPAPQLTAIDPGSVVVGVPSVVVEVEGIGFSANSVVRVNDVPRPTVFVSSSRLIVTLSNEDVDAIGTLAVTTFTSGGGTSNAMSLVVRYSTSDPNCDGIVGADDVLNAMRMLSGAVPQASACGTFNPSGNGTLSIADVLRMRQIAAGIVPAP